MTQTPIPAFEDLLAHVAEHRAEFTTLRHVPRETIEEFRRAGIYRAATPRRFGGDALAPGDFLRMVERISEVDGSAGWVASFGSSAVYLAALPLESLGKLYADSPDVVFAGALVQIGRAH